jgi:energy-coupling factor transport system ATP-binding protein
MAVLNLRDVTYTYPLTTEPVLKNVSLRVEEGEFVAVIGPNGAGKSTLCYTISGFIPHFYKGELAGAVELDGVDVRETTLSQRVLRAGLVFQNPFNQITGAKYNVYDEIAFGLENIGVGREAMHRRIQQAMELTGIADLAERSPYSLSGGQQQRVALTSILVMEPRILVLDEPTSQMDPIGTREVFGVIKAMSDRGMTVVMVEHKMEWIAAFADRVVALDHGEVVMEGTPRQVLAAPELVERGFGTSRYTQVARAARQQQLWPDDEPLPVTLEEAVKGFGRRAA